MNAKNSGVPKISKLWSLGNLLPVKHTFTPVFVDLKWQDFDGKIVKSGGKELAFELEKKGYDWIKKEIKS